MGRQRMEEKKRIKAEYRSSLRSKRLIREALIRMMREKPFEKITITDIVKTADINRGTFYAHFRDTSEVLSSIKELAESEISEVLNGLTPDMLLANPRLLFDSLTAMLAKDREYYRLILSVEEFRRAIMENRQRIVNDYLMKSTAVQRLSSDPSVKQSIVATFDFLVAGVMGLYADVLSEAIPAQLEDLPETLAKITGCALRQLADPLR